MDKTNKPTGTLDSLTTAGNTKDKVHEPKGAAAITAMPTNHTDIDRSRIHIVENFHLVWLDGSIDKIKNEDCHNTITKLRQVVNTVHTFTDVNECINFIRKNEEEKTFVEFITYLREQCDSNITKLENVDKLEQEYHAQDAIQWYTFNYPLYTEVNEALRTMEVDLIIKMGFFVQDLHKHITRLHSEQYSSRHNSDLFTVYRGQRISKVVFKKLEKTPGGLLSFNNLLSTSLNREVALMFAANSQDDRSRIGVLFQMNIDRSISSTHFADIRNISKFQNEDEILFSMHSIFRTGYLKQIKNNSVNWQVDLMLTSDNDPELHAVTECIRKDLQQSKGWDQLSQLLINLGHFDQAEELYQSLLRQTSIVRENATFYYQLGCIKFKQGKYLDAITFHVTVLHIYQEYLLPDHSGIGKCHNDIGLMYESMAKYSQALLSHEKALGIYEKNLSENHIVKSTGNSTKVCVF